MTGWVWIIWAITQSGRQTRYQGPESEPKAKGLVAWWFMTTPAIRQRLSELQPWGRPLGRGG